MIKLQTMDAEELLVARLMAGDGDAFVEIVDRFSPLLCGLARRVTANAALAEDIVQEVFIDLWRRPDRFDPNRGSLRAFLAIQAHRRSIDAVRTAVRRTKREVRHHILDIARVKVGRRDSEPSDEAERAATAAGVKEAVKQLPLEQRIVVELVYFGGRTYREVAQELGIPEGTAKSRIRLAQAKLKSLLRQELLESSF